jgi:hypothetical protein
LVVVFDPLALVLIIAGLSIMHRPVKLDNSLDALPPATTDIVPTEPTDPTEPITQLTMPSTLPTSGIKINRTLHDN